MGVRAGYKQTEVGVIPADWSVMPFGQLFAFANGVNADKTAYGKGFRFINVLEPISYSHIYGPEIPGRVQVSGAVALAYSVKPGDIVFNRTSETDSELGLAAVYLGDEQVVFGGFVIRGRPVDDDLDPIYAGYALRAEVIRSQIIPMGQGAVRANIGQQNLRQVLAVVPPKSEQRAIATALSDVDALLDGLTRLIAKKRDLKQATMQQLLTGQTRLPGFSNEWVESRLRDVIEEIGDGGTPATSNPRNFGGAINWVVIEDIKDEISATALKLTEQGLKSCTAKLWPPDTLIVSTGATIGEVGIARVPLATKQGICGVVVDKSKAIPDYLKYWFRLNKPLLLAKAQGSTIKEIRAPTLVQLELRVPSVTEQDAIVSVLSAMDAELSALEARLIKTRALKQAMMSELLTGKTRLPTA